MKRLAGTLGSRQRWIVPIIVALAFFIEQFDTAALIVSLPVIARDLGVEPLQLASVVTAYVLSVVLFMPTSGWLANRFGMRRTFVGALLIYAAGSLGCILSPSFEILLASRILQGVGGALMTPVGRLIMLRSFGRHELIAAMSLMTAPVLFGPLLGPLVGGFLSTHFNWRWTFLASLPVIAVGVLATLRIVPRDAPAAGRFRFDLKGFFLLSPALVLMQIVIGAFGLASTSRLALAGAMVLALLLLVVYWRHARLRVRAALLDVSLFFSATFRAGTLTGGLSRIGFNSVPFLLPLYLQFALGLKASEAGMLVALAIVGALVAKPFNGRLVRSFGFRGVLAGSAFLGAALIAALALQDPDLPSWMLACHIAAIGAVQTIQYNTLNIVTYAEVDSEDLSSASSLGGVVHQLAMGLAVSWSAAALALVGEGAPLTAPHFAVVFLIAGLLPFLAGMSFCRMTTDHPEP